jgi:hypothetical protein
MEKVPLELTYPNEFILFPLLAWLKFVYIPFNIAQRTWTLHVHVHQNRQWPLPNRAYLVTSARFGWAIARIQVCRLVIKIIVITWKKMLSKFTLQIRQYFWSCIFSRLFTHPMTKASLGTLRSYIMLRVYRPCSGKYATLNQNRD